MALSPFALPFFSCSSLSKLCKRDFLLAKAKASLSIFDFNLLLCILSEWEGNLFLDSCFSLWQKYVPLNEDPLQSSLLVLSFNVRGLELRWQEAFLLTSSFSCDILVLLETGNVELSFYEKIFNNFRMFYQKGENKNGGILILVKFGIKTIRFECNQIT